MMDEGYIKFNCTWIESDPLPEYLIAELNTWRGMMYKNGLVGVYESGIGFGNLSIRHNQSDFIITGSGTGGFINLTQHHYTLVTAYNFSSNSLTCMGPVKASSESLSHAIIYECSPETRAVIHIHHKEMWERLKGRIPTTDDAIAFGTPEMALEIKRLFNDTDIQTSRILVMGGHEEGIISFGRTPEEAGKILLEKII